MSASWQLERFAGGLVDGRFSALNRPRSLCARPVTA